LVRAKITVNENHFRFDRKTFFNFWIIFFVFTRTFDIWLVESSNSRSFENRQHRNPASSSHWNNAGVGIRQPEYCQLLESGDIRQLRRIPAESGRNPVMDRNRPESGLIWPDPAKWPESDLIWPDPDTDPAGSGQNGRDPAGYDRIRTLIRLDLTKMTGIRPDMTGSGYWSGRIWPGTEVSCRNPAILAGSGPTCSPDSGDGDICIFTFRNFFVRTKRRKIFSRK
jgi:hypothetical protein